MECACSCFGWTIMLFLALLLLVGNPVAFLILMAVIILIKIFER